MKRCFVFAAGFGFDATYWTRLRAHFADEFCVDLSDVKVMPGFQYIGIGHSLGLIKLIKSSLSFSCLVGLNGFVNFLGNNSVLRLRRQSEFDRFSRQLGVAPEKTFSKFFKRCGVDGLSYSSLAIRDDLVLLAEAVSYEGQRLMVVAAEDDVVVPSEVIIDNFADTIRIEWLGEGGHALGYVHAARVYQMIMGFVNEAADTKTI